MESTERILVTGAAGFIGAAVARALIGRGDQVTGIDNFSPYYDINLKKARLNFLVGAGHAGDFNDAFQASLRILEQVFEICSISRCT